MHLDRFFKHTAAAIAIAPKCDVSLVALLLLLMLAAERAECRSGALSLISSDTFSMESDSILYFVYRYSVLLRQDGFFLE